ncbi:MAG: GNAT family N-acetyltransferase [Halioglobus sp.]|nr:GNAT family N-acetyltransferase [Halioglobus sp.]|tara:strand:- start:1342 stop:1791 length:450 start_codon:yes stop_codon:yes gene_type:complete
MKIEAHDGDITDELWQLLLDADPDRATVTRYLEGSTRLVALDGEDIAGIAVVTTQGNQAELKNIAVQPSYRGQGVAKQLIGQAKRAAAAGGATSMKVGTGNSSLAQLALYQKCGFRMHGIERDFFRAYPEPIVENGIRCLDMVVLMAEL